MNDATMTISGNLVDAPKLRRTKNGHCVANFRVASTPRRYDRDKGVWVDGDTLFVTVTAWRALAENVADSLHKGEPVVVFGRYSQREYEQNETLRTAYELEATAVGHDLNRGTTAFARKSRAAAMQVDLDADGIPADQTSHYLDLADDDEPGSEAGQREAGNQMVPPGVDPRTGEVLELASVS